MIKVLDKHKPRIDLNKKYRFYEEKSPFWKHSLT